MRYMLHGLKELAIAAVVASSLLAIGLYVGRPIHVALAADTTNSSSHTGRTNSGSSGAATTSENIPPTNSQSVNAASAKATAEAAAQAAQQAKQAEQQAALQAKQAAQTAKEQQQLTTLQSKANDEIQRRLGNLNTLYNVISLDVKMTSSDKSSLNSEVNGTISGLKSLQTTIDQATTLQAALTAAQGITTEYRVYLLVTPQIYIIRAADDQQVIESKLTTIAQKIQSHISGLSNAASFASTLSNMNSEISAAQSISVAVDNAVIPLNAQSYDANNSVLGGYVGQLETARADLLKAQSDALSIINQLKPSGSGSGTSPSPTPSTPTNSSS
ncbi:MAG TPA: hypothetical protein VGS28_04145 [Candidatus Saccharimonadales bacterium]|nr:hypothetical protein [Candidatus Saccharimonadales bacterium]